MKKNMSIIRAFSMFITIIMIFSFSSVAFASEPLEDSQVTVLEPNSDSTVTLEEALDLLGTTEEASKNSTIYVYDIPITVDGTNRASTRILTPSDNAILVGEFSFTNKNVGSFLVAFRNASKAQFGVGWKWLNPDDRTTVVLQTVLTNSEGDSRIEDRAQSGFGDGNYNKTFSEVGQISSNYTYHFEYGAYYGYWAGEDFPPIQIRARVAIQCFT